MRISDWSSDVCSSDLAAPRQLAPDLLFERGVGRSAGLQELGEVLGLALEVLSHAGEGLLHLGLGDRDLVAARFLNLELFVDEVTQNLHAQALAFRRIDLSAIRSEEHTSDLQSLMRISYAVFCLKKKKTTLS